MTHEQHNVTLRGYGSCFVLVMPWHIGVALDWSLVLWAADPYVS
jgi:hypothetical protein